MVLVQSIDHSKHFTTPAHSPMHTHIHTLMAEAANQGANCSSGAYSSGSRGFEPVIRLLDNLLYLLSYSHPFALCAALWTHIILCLTSKLDLDTP